MTLRPAQSTVVHPDGIVCFGGEDWWYHNRGHFDMQIMRRLAKRMPVLYVNSIGMRRPRLGEGRTTLARVRRKLRSYSRGFARIDDGFAVLSPITVPGMRAWSKPIAQRQISGAMASLGMRHPLAWVACPTAVDLLDSLPFRDLVYQRTDRYECFDGVDAREISRCDQTLKRDAAITVYCARTLLDGDAAGCRRTAWIDHGVDFERFAGAARDARVPEDLAAIPGPRVGFIGGIDSHTFDAPLFRDVAQRMPHVSFALVGACSISQWGNEADTAARGQANSLPANVHFLGKRAYESVAAYMAGCDVLIMPWRKGAWIEACNPIKLKEYLATGRPIVSTSFPELRRFSSHCRVADTASDFAAAIDDALARPGTGSLRQQSVRDCSWEAQVDRLVRRLRAAGIALPGQPEDVFEADSYPLSNTRRAA